MVQLEKVGAVAKKIVESCDELYAEHVRRSTEHLHRLQDEVTSYHKQLFNQLQDVAGAQVHFIILFVLLFLFYMYILLVSYFLLTWLSGYFGRKLSINLT